MSLGITVTLLETPAQIKQQIMKALLVELNIKLAKAAIYIKQNLPAVLRVALTNQDEYNSIVGGDLREHFGIPDGVWKLSVILDKWLDTIMITTKKFKYVGGNITGGLTVQAIRSDFRDVMSLTEAYQITEKGEDLHWLHWLLLAGDAIIIKDYIIVEGGLFHGRAGTKIMRSKKSGRWSVPSQYRGNEENNWTTRAIKSANDKLNQLFAKAF